jgi:hypothetical protein
MEYVLKLVELFLFCLGITYLGGSAIVALREVNDRRHIYLGNSVRPFSCYYSRSLVL